MRQTMPARMAIAAALLALFAFRLAFGLSSEFFFEDETQIFLMGLRYYADGRWPFFGPDVVWTKSEIPGALQALLVGVPLRIVPAPESPFVLLNLLSFAALAALAWYTCASLPWVPRWLVWGWFLTIPWTLQFSTHIINPSYVLAAAIVFFIGFFEAVPRFTIGRIRPAAAHFLMGAAIAWTMQVHLSWPLLLPYAAWAWFARRGGGPRALATNAASFAAGALVPGLLLVPTWIAYGWQAGSGGTTRNLHLHWVNPWIIVTTAARFFSFASLEINRFIGTDGAKRMEFFQRHLWLIPLAAVVWIAGIVQPIWMLIELFRSKRRCPLPAVRPRWQAFKWLIVWSILLVYASYWFVLEPPQAHAFYVLAPAALVFAAYCWTAIDSPRARRMAAALIAVNVAFHAGLAWAQAPEQSLYKNRAIVVAAIRHRQPEMLAHRRPFAPDAGPYWLDQSQWPYDPLRDVTFGRPAYAIGFRRSLHWTFTVCNNNRQVAYRDLLYITKYATGSDTIVDERHEFIKDVFEPGECRVVDVNDGFVLAPFEKATIEIAGAEALMPLFGGRE